MLKNVAYNYTFSPAQLALRVINLGTVGRSSWFSPTHLQILPNQPFKRLLPEGLADLMLSAASKIPANNKTWIKDILTADGILNVSPVQGEDPSVNVTPASHVQHL
jgi:hypothetical protein